MSNRSSETAFIEQRSINSNPLYALKSAAGTLVIVIEAKELLIDIRRIH
jgi:hypothetical protein